MPSPKKPVRLGVNVLASGRHDAAWKTLPDPASLSTDIDAFLRIARVAEGARSTRCSSPTVPAASSRRRCTGPGAPSIR